MEKDSLYERAVELAREKGTIGAPMLQMRLKFGYLRANQPCRRRGLSRCAVSVPDYP